MLRVEDVVRMASCSMRNTDPWSKIMDWTGAVGDLDTLKAVVDALPIDSQKEDDPDPSFVISTAMLVGERMAELFVELIHAADIEQESGRLLGLAVKYFDHPITIGALCHTLRELEEWLRAGGEEEELKLAIVLYLHGTAIVIQETGADGWSPYFED